jgi:hypothetical protein
MAKCDLPEAMQSGYATNIHKKWTGMTARSCSSDLQLNNGRWLRLTFVDCSSLKVARVRLPASAKQCIAVGFVGFF